MQPDVGQSYSRRADEYIELLGDMASVHPADRHLVTDWASHVDGPLLDAGCGPGHWAAHLAARGHDARGLDQVAAFIQHAREACPVVPFEVGSIDSIGHDAESFGGVLAWYSLIHHEPSAIHVPLAEFARVRRPGGRLLVGFFPGAAVEAFDHAVVTAYRWPAEELARALGRAGFTVEETHTRTVRSARPHGALLATLE